MRAQAGDNEAMNRIRHDWKTLAFCAIIASSAAAPGWSQSWAGLDLNASGAASGVLDALTNRLQDADTDVRYYAIQALGNIVSLSDDKPATIAALVNAMVADPDPSCRGVAEASLNSIRQRP